MKYLQEPEWTWRAGTGDFVHQWVKPLGESSADMVLYGAPISRSSISVSGASLYPMALRQMWKGFSTYNLDQDVNLSSYSVADAGDVVMHTTDILLSHQRIEETTHELVSAFESATTCLFGGDHSITACAVRGVKRAFPSERIGILQLDTHLDVRDPAEIGPANGTPIRQLIDGRIVRGEDVVNIGLHGYFNAAPLVAYAKEHSIRMVTLRKARELGVAVCVEEQLGQLAKRVDRVYVTIDMDVLDISDAPGVPASTPGGMSAEELFQSLQRIGQHDAVRHIDFVCLDPTRDTASNATVKIGVYAWLEFITGRVISQRRK